MFEDWPNCETPDCENKQCTWARLPYCFPCSERMVGKEEMIRRFNATHDMTWEQAKAAEEAEELEERIHFSEQRDPFTWD